MILTKEQQAGIVYIQQLLTANRAKFNIPNNVPLNTLFLREGESQHPQIFDQDYTVGQILSIDPSEEIPEEFDELDFFGDAAYGMRNSIEELPHFYVSPDGSGRIPVTAKGLKTLTLNGVEPQSATIALYANLYKQLSNTLCTSREAENGTFEVIPGDLSDPEVLNRMVVKNENGKWEPAFSDLSKFRSELKQDRLDAMLELESVVRRKDVYIREEDGQYSQLKLADNRTLYRGDYDRPTLEASIHEKYPTVHGPVAMFFMRLLRAFGVSSFDEKIHAQEEVERQAENELKARTESRRNESDIIRNTHNNDVTADALPVKDWSSHAAIEAALLNPKSPRGKAVADMKGLAYDFELLGLLAGVITQEADPEITNQVIDGILTGKELWKDPKLKKHLENGFRKFDEAKKASVGANGQDDPTVLRDLLRDGIRALSNFAGSAVPLDNRINKVADLTHDIVFYARSYPSLEPAIRGSEISERVNGIYQLSAMTKEGLEAQYNLANRRTSPAKLGDEVGIYLAMKTAEQINLSRALQIKEGKPVPAEDFISLLGRYGRAPFQNALLNSAFVQGFDSREQGKSNLNRAAALAVDGYTNGSRSEIVGIARDAAGEFSNLHKADGAQAQSSVQEDRVAAYRPMKRPEVKYPAITDGPKMNI